MELEGFDVKELTGPGPYVLTVPRKLSPTEAEKIRQAWTQAAGDRKLLVLEDGLKIHDR